MQKQLNENFYLTIQQDLRKLALKSARLSYGELLSEFNTIKERVFWSDWGLQGNLTKKALVVYLDTLFVKINKKDKNYKFLSVYLFDRQVKENRRKMHERYNIDFKG